MQEKISDGKIIDKLTSKVKIYLVIIALLLILICVYNTHLIIPSVIFYVCLVAYSIWVSGKKRNEIVSHIEEYTTDVNFATKSILINSPLPLILVETDGNIIWKSKKFVKEFMNTDVATYIDGLVKEIKLDIENSNEVKEITKTINIENKVYNIKISYTKSKKRDSKKQKEYLLTMYFIDDTKYNELFDKYNNSKICVGIAVIDNYEEIQQRILPENKPQITANFEKHIYEWAAQTGGLIVKAERDRFVYIFEQQYLQDLERDKFNILDTIKTIKLDTTAETKMQLTLSIAISNEGKTIYEKYKSALAGIDIVLGRGGDQAIVRKDGKYKFFGGKTLEVEKRTRVKARIVAHALEELIADSKDVFIMGHTNPDIDSIGSSLGIYRIAKTLGKEAYIVNNSQGTTMEKFWDVLTSEKEYEKIIVDRLNAMSKITSKSLLVIVDTHKKGYVEVPELLNETDRVVVIDHHRKSTDFIENPLLTFHEVYASSAAELVTELIQYTEAQVEPSMIEVESLYGGIMVDTKDFTFKTGVRTFEAAAYLRKFGVDIIKVKKWFQTNLENYNLIADIVKNAEMTNDSIAISVYDKQDKNANLICAKAADELLTISDVSASFVIGNLEDRVCISGRSIGDINVQIILEKLGGGGHITLAGAQLNGVTIEEAKEELIKRINEYFSETTSE